MSNSIIYIPKPNPNAKVQLFCIPYAGGSVSAFYNWSSNLPDIELGLIAYPGRYHRTNEKPIFDIELMLQTIFNDCKNLITKDFAIFGHSMGSIIGYGVAQKLEQAGMKPKCLFVSAASAPTRHMHKENQLSSLSDDDFVRVLIERYNAIPEKIVHDRELMKIFLPLLRADISLEEQFIEKYDVKNGPKLSCDLTAFGGLMDVEVTDDLLSTWEPLTTGDFKKKMFPGTHFYLNEHPDLLFKEILQIL